MDMLRQLLNKKQGGRINGHNVVCVTINVDGDIAVYIDGARHILHDGGYDYRGLLSVMEALK